MPEETKPAFKCIVSADLFRRAWFAVSTEETRYYLNGVFIEPCPEGGALLTATDGHCLLSFRDPRGWVEGSGIVSLSGALRRELVTKANDLFTDAASKGRFPQRVVMASSDLGAAFVVASSERYKLDGVEIEPRDELRGLFEAPDSRIVGAQYRGAIIDGTFPDWRRAVPAVTNPKLPVGAFNASILTRLGQALGDGKNQQCRVIAKADENPEAAPHLVLGNNAFMLEGFGVIMPLRWGGPMALPAYFTKSSLAVAA